MKFKIEKYFYKTIFIIFICSNLTLILFHLAYFYKVNNEKQIYFEEKMAKETKQNIKIFHNLLMNVYPNIAEKLKNIHNHVRHSKDFQITKKELKKMKYSIILILK